MNLLHDNYYLVTKYLVWFQIWPSHSVKVSAQFRFYFNERLTCSVVILFQSNLNWNLDLSCIVNEALMTISSQFFFFTESYWAYKKASKSKTNNFPPLTSFYAKNIVVFVVFCSLDYVFVGWFWFDLLFCMLKIFL